MNKRLEELAEEAGFPKWSDKTIGFELEKFAELIIKECCYTIDDGDGVASSISENVWRQQCIREIKKHFGV